MKINPYDKKDQLYDYVESVRGQWIAEKAMGFTNDSWEERFEDMEQNDDVYKEMCEQRKAENQ